MEIESVMSELDILMGMLVGALILCVAVLLTRTSPDRRVVCGALVLKLASCFALCAMAIPVFKSGDMVGYHHHGLRYAGMLADDLQKLTMSYLSTTPFFFPEATSTERTRSLSGLVHFFTFGSYIASSMIFAVIGFLGQLHLYRTFSRAYPSPRLLVWWRAGILFMPSFTFWSAGLLKDPIGIWALGLAVSGAFALLKWNRYSGIIRVIVGVYTLMLFRAQVAPVLLLAISPIFIATKLSPAGAKPSFLTEVVQFFVRFGLLLVLPVVFTYAIGMDKRLEYSDFHKRLLNERYQYRSIEAGTTVLESENRDASAAATPLSMLLSWPGSVVFCLFRPFLWESFKSPVVLMAGVENTILMVLVIRAIFHALTKPSVLTNTIRSPLFLASMIFVGLFTYGLGLATPNLGTVSRYRIPVIPFLVGALAIVEHHLLEYRQRRMPVCAIVPLENGLRFGNIPDLGELHLERLR